MPTANCNIKYNGNSSSSNNNGNGKMLCYPFSFGKFLGLCSKCSLCAIILLVHVVVKCFSSIVVVAVVFSFEFLNFFFNFFPLFFTSFSFSLLQSFTKAEIEVAFVRALTYQHSKWFSYGMHTFFLFFFFYMLLVVACPLAMATTAANERMN